MGRIVLSIFILLISASLLLRCNDYTFPASPYPRVETLPVANVSSSGVTFEGAVTYLGEKPILQHGFVWGLSDNISANDGDKIVMGEIVTTGDFLANVESGLYGDSTYYVKAFVVTDSYLVYGKVVSFISKGSKPPSLISISPKEGIWGDTVIFKGKNFSKIATKNIVKFGSFNSTVVSSTDSTLKCVVPENIPDKTVPVHVIVAGAQSTEVINFTFTTPAIQSIAPQLGTFEDIVTIKGTYFSATKARNIVKFNEHTAEVIEATNLSLKVKVPTSLSAIKNEVKVTVNLQSSLAGVTFDLLPPSISSFSSASGLIGSTVQLVGDNFNPLKTGDNVYFGSLKAEVVSATRKQLSVIVPNGIYPERSSIIKVTAAAQDCYSPLKFTIKDAWLRKSVIPTNQPQGGAVGFEINDEGYIGLGSKFGFVFDTFWKYQPSTDTWTSVAKFPATKRGAAFSFATSSHAYVGGGFNPYTGESLYDFWRFDPIANSWTRMADLPFEARTPVALSAGDKGYVLLNMPDTPTANFWTYNPGTNQWTGMPDFPGADSPTSGFVIGDNLYVYTADYTTAPNQLIQYSLFDNEWVSKAEIDDYTIEYEVDGFAIDGKGYILDEQGLREYDPLSDSWTTIDSNFVGRGGSNTFVVGDKFYFGYGLGDVIDFWEWDPKYK